MNKYTGNLIYYFATGEGPHPFIIVDHPTDDVWSKTYVIGKAGIPKIKIIHPKTQQVVYSGSWTFSRAKTAAASYYASPEEIESKQWIRYCIEEYLVEFETEYKIEADRSRLKLISKIDLFIKKPRSIEVEDSEVLIDRGVSLWRCLEGERLELIDSKGKNYYSEGVVINFEFNQKAQQVIVRTTKESFVLKLVSGQPTTGSSVNPGDV